MVTYLINWYESFGIYIIIFGIYVIIVNTNLLNWPESFLFLLFSSLLRSAIPTDSTCNGSDLMDLTTFHLYHDGPASSSPHLLLP